MTRYDKLFHEQSLAISIGYITDVSPKEFADMYTGHFKDCYPDDELDDNILKLEEKALLMI